MRRLKVLIADDHRLMLHSIRLALEADDEIEIVAEVDSGTKVIPFIGQTGPDLVLLDIRMPGIDGLTVLERIRERYPQVKVAILSGVDDPSVIQAAFDRGAAAFIVKHIDPRDLPSALRQAVEGTVFQPLGLLESVSNGAAEDVDLTKREHTILEALQTRPIEQADRREAVSRGADGEVPPDEHLPEARREQPHRSRPVRVRPRHRRAAPVPRRRVAPGTRTHARV